MKRYIIDDASIGSVGIWTEVKQTYIIDEYQ